MSEATATYLFLYLRLFLITQVVEMPVYWFAMGERPAWQRLAIGFGASAITHPPFVILLHPHLRPLGPMGALILGETLVVAVEGLYLKLFKVEQPWLWSLTANAASVAVGMTLGAIMRPG